MPRGNQSKLRAGASTIFLSYSPFFLSCAPAEDPRQLYHLYVDESFSLLPKRNLNQAISALLVCVKVCVN